MCGISGIALRKGTAVNRNEFMALLESLFAASQRRGSESSGLHVNIPSANRVWTLKAAKSARHMMKSAEYTKVFQSVLGLAFPDADLSNNKAIIIMTHSRLATNGSTRIPANNQPIRWGRVTTVHNGIIVNSQRMWADLGLQPATEVDTEVLSAHLNQCLCASLDAESAVRNLYAHIEGAASLAWADETKPGVTLATNTGDLFTAVCEDLGLFVFASEEIMLRRAVANTRVKASVSRLNPGMALEVDVGQGLIIREFQIFRDPATTATPIDSRSRPTFDEQDERVEHIEIAVSYGQRASTRNVRADFQLLLYNENAIRAMQRCSRCVLPETFPYIRFDAEQICNYCQSYQPRYSGYDSVKAMTEFEQLLSSYRNGSGGPDVLVPLSGGRDSIYGLHLLREVFEVNPITFTYDWGMITDLARRNISRVCGKLGVQNILVAADIQVKRANVRKNVTAWLRDPRVGMVPLFMAGDKQFIRIANQIRGEIGVRLHAWSVNPFENTDFKVGLAGVRPAFQKRNIDDLSSVSKARLGAYYGAMFLKNPSYMNSSLRDTLSAFRSYYVEPRDDIVSIFQHLKWDEQTVEDTIQNQYGFEKAPDTASTWRIGDGTAPFYNYIYVTANGYSEFDTFRSNQVREGQLSRNEALNLVVRENRPRIEGLLWYFEALNLDFNDVIPIINSLDTRGLHR
jgi:glucosamine--fructose-6-phosphate aminotransferase (isomerizing)